MQLEKFIGLGVAGNFTGHLEQAGEAADFQTIKTQESVQPKAIFPFYVPSQQLTDNDRFLSTYPLSSETLSAPLNHTESVQIEPEVALFCDIAYQNRKVIGLKATHFSAYNDASIRRPNAHKICEKKNWGKNSKGLSTQLIEIDHFTKNGALDEYRIACFHKRNGILNEYGVNSPVLGYSYFHQKLLDWIIEKMNNQLDQGPMNNISQLLQLADYPKKAIISIGATTYTSFGERNFLQVGDKSIVLLYKETHYSQEEIVEMAYREQFGNHMSTLIQSVV